MRTEKELRNTFGNILIGMGLSIIVAIIFFREYSLTYSILMCFVSLIVLGIYEKEKRKLAERCPK